MLFASVAPANAKVRLFILSGQSNMARFQPDVSFTPALKKAFPADELIVVKSAQGGQPIRNWYQGPKMSGGLYDGLMAKVKQATQGKTIDTITFVWMQGESDAQRDSGAAYEENLRGLVKMLRDDLKRPDMRVVIGRAERVPEWEGWLGHGSGRTGEGCRIRSVGWLGRHRQYQRRQSCASITP